MAFTGITATEDQIDQKSGENVSTNYTDAMKTTDLLEAENFLNVETEYNWSDAFATLNADVKSLVTAYTASWVASCAINYDLDAIGRISAETQLDFLSEKMRVVLKTLNVKSKQAWAVAVT